MYNEGRRAENMRNRFRTSETFGGAVALRKREMEIRLPFVFYLRCFIPCFFLFHAYIFRFIIAVITVTLHLISLSPCISVHVTNETPTFFKDLPPPKRFPLYVPQFTSQDKRLLRRLRLQMVPLTQKLKLYWLKKKCAFPAFFSYIFTLKAL